MSTSHPTAPPRADSIRGVAQRSLSKKMVFALTFLVTVIVSLVWFYFTKPPRMAKLSREVSIASQVKPGNIRFIKDIGFKTIVDVRPDGEAVGQPSSEEMRGQAERLQLEFHYIPVAHEGASESDVTKLRQVFGTCPKPVVLYCRTGRRAVRLFALAEASRVDGPNVDEILKMVEKLGFSAVDLEDDISARIVLRGKERGEQKSP